jgi:prolyl oligopeptidase PreP (S9A serine peptidase family)
VKDIYESERDKFIRHANAYLERIEAADSRGANAENQAAAKIVKNLAQRQEVDAFLLSLLSHESTAVRFFAAAHLINFDSKDQAIAVLRELADAQIAWIAPAANAVLRVNKMRD